MSLNYEYERALKFTIPAVRIAVAKELRKTHRINEHEIAGRLGIAQAAISKYLNGRYSKEVRRMVDAVESRGLQHRIVNAILSKNEDADVAEAIDDVASSAALVRIALDRSEGK